VSDYFPGSRQKIAPPAGPPDPLGGLTGTVTQVKGRPVELFTIGQLSQVLNRRPVAIRAWETEGVIPKATYVKPGKDGDKRGRRRLYSRAQVEALVRIAAEEGILHDKHKQISRTQFASKVLEAFRQIARQA
jgi:hypothetical protein